MGLVPVVINLAIASYDIPVTGSILEFPLHSFTINFSDQSLLLASWRQAEIAKVCFWYMSCSIKPIIFCVSSIRAVYSCAFAFSFHFCPGCPWTTAGFWGGGSRCMWSGEDWSKILVVMVPFLPQTFCVNHFISSMFWGSLSCFHSLWDPWLLLLKWVLKTS